MTASACRADTGIDIVVGDDGSGTVSVAVTLDEAAAAKLGDLSEELVLDDLRAAGWNVRGPRSADEVQFEATRAFDSPEQLGPIMRQLGPPFRDFRLLRKDGFAETTYELQGCTKGHILLCVAGRLDTELADGRTFTLSPGMSYQVADAAEPHRSATDVGATLFIVD